MKEYEDQVAATRAGQAQLLAAIARLQQGKRGAARRQAGGQPAAGRSRGQAAPLRGSRSVLCAQHRWLNTASRLHLPPAELQRTWQLQPGPEVSHASARLAKLKDRLHALGARAGELEVRGLGGQASGRGPLMLG